MRYAKGIDRQAEPARKVLPTYVEMLRRDIVPP